MKAKYGKAGRAGLLAAMAALVAPVSMAHGQVTSAAQRNASAASARQPLTPLVAVSASKIPAGWQAEHFAPLAHVRFGHIAFKMTLASRADRTYLYMAAAGGHNPDGTHWEGFSVVDVSDAAYPRIVRRVPVRFASGQVTSDGRLLIVGHTRLGIRRAQRAAGAASPFVSIYDLADPANPRLLSTFEGVGNGTHRNTYPGGRYMYLSSELEDYRGNVLQIVDISNPSAPRETSRFWLPGQAKSEQQSEIRMGFHGPLAVSADGNMLTMGYAPSLINVDISDATRPRLVGRLDFSPSDNQGMTFMHTGQPLYRGVVHVNTEPHEPGCSGFNANFAALVDNSDPRNPKLTSFYPRPRPPAGYPVRSFCDLPQWFGMHNINQEGHNPSIRGAGRLVFATMFSGGLRAYDVSDPNFPAEVGWFLPPNNNLIRSGSDDVVMDRRGNIYMSDSFGQTMWVLRYSGPDPDRTTN